MEEDKKKLINILLNELSGKGDLLANYKNKSYTDLSSLILKFNREQVPLNPLITAIVDEYINKLANDYTDFITKDFKLLSLWYMLNVLRQGYTKEVEELFYTIYTQMDDLKTIFENRYGFQFFIEFKKFEDIIENIFFYNQNPIDQNFIYKVAYIPFLCFERGEYFLHLFEKLKKIYFNALDEGNSDLAFYIYTILLFTSNTIKSEPADLKKFNDEIEKSLDEHIRKSVIPKYRIKPNLAKNNKKKIAFVLDRVIPNSIHHVFESLLGTLSKQKDLEYEFFIYSINYFELNGSVLETVEELKNFGFTYVDFHEMFVGDEEFTYSIVEKSIKMREYIIEQGVDTLIMYNGRPEFDFLFATRTAPQQIYWSHGNSEYDVEGIDKRISHFEQRTHNEQFEIFKLPIDFKRYNPEVDKNIVQKIKELYPKDAFILGYIGRLVKIEDDDYLGAVATILKQNPHTIFLACGSGEQSYIRKKIDKLGVGDRFYFTGHINSHIYGHVIDLFLTSFHSGGEALREYTYKEKSYVVKHRYYELNIDTCKNYNLLDKLRKSNNESQYYELYTQDDINSLLKNGYLVEENKAARMYTCIPSVKDIDEYIEVANLLINNIEIRQKVAKETVLMAKLDNKELNNSFLDLLSSKKD